LVFGEAELGDEGEKDVFAGAGNGSEHFGFVAQLAERIEKIKGLY